MSYYGIKARKDKKSTLFENVLSKVKNAFVDIENEKLDLKMRYVDIIRGEEYINDFRDTFGDQYTEADEFGLVDLITILYLDFIGRIKSGDYSHKFAALSLLEGKKKFLDDLNKPKVKRKEIHQVSRNTYILEDIEEDEEEEEYEAVSSNEYSMSDVVYLEYSFNIRQNNRCKVFLYDIEPYLNGEELKVEDVIVLRYLEFIEKIRIEGNNARTMKRIMNYYRRQKER